MVEVTPSSGGDDLYTAKTLADAAGGERAESVRFTGPATIGRFVLLRKLGEGGMGEVFSAYDERLDRRVAIKLLHASRESEETRLRLLREAQALARLSHPNVVAVHEVGETHDGNVFAVMEHIDGTTLRDWQAEGRTVEEILAAYRTAAIGLEAVHEAGMVHRDFKPANVMIDRTGRVRLLDLGLAHARTSAPGPTDGAGRPHGVLDARLTATGALVGTPAYMSPELFSGEPVGAASDQFSFCVALYEALYAVHPFTGGTALAIASKVLAGAVRPPPARPDVPPRVTEALLRGLSRAPSARFASMAELGAALSPEADRWGQRRERVVIAALVVGMMATTFLLGEVFAPAMTASREGVLWIALVPVGLITAVTIHYRNTLVRNAFYRRRLFTIVVTSCFILASRIVSFGAGEDMVSVALRDLMLCGVGVGVALLWATPRTWLLWLAALIPALCTLIVIAAPALVEEAVTAGMNLTMLAYLADWLVSERRRAAAPSAGQRSSVAGGSSPAD